MLQHFFEFIPGNENLLRQVNVLNPIIPDPAANRFNADSHFVAQLVNSEIAAVWKIGHKSLRLLFIVQPRTKTRTRMPKSSISFVKPDFVDWR